VFFCHHATARNSALNAMQSGSTRERNITVIGWQGRLNEASTPEDVVKVARDFLARWLPHELQRLPAECLPGKIVDADDVNQYALTLVQRSCAGDRMGDGLLQQMAAFFTRASLRLAQITAQATEVSSEARD
jgi:hypothetical protein